MHFLFTKLTVLNQNSELLVFNVILMRRIILPSYQTLPYRVFLLSLPEISAFNRGTVLVSTILYHYYLI